MCKLINLCIAALCISASASEGIIDTTAKVSYFSSYLDNDLFSGTDENYTNGLGIKKRHNWILSYVQTYRSKEFDTQRDSQPFGSLTLAKKF